MVAWRGASRPFPSSPGVRAGAGEQGLRGAAWLAPHAPGPWIPTLPVCEMSSPSGLWGQGALLLLGLAFFLMHFLNLSKISGKLAMCLDHFETLQILADLMYGAPTRRISLYGWGTWGRRGPRPALGHAVSWWGVWLSVLVRHCCPAGSVTVQYF